MKDNKKESPGNSQEPWPPWSQWLTTESSTYGGRHGDADGALLELFGSAANGSSTEVHASTK